MTLSVLLVTVSTMLALICLPIVVRLTSCLFVIPARNLRGQGHPKFRKNWYVCTLLPDTGRAGAYVLISEISKLLVHWLWSCVLLLLIPK